MPPKGKGTNSHVVKANERKAANKAVKDRAAAADMEKVASAEWAKGSNLRGTAKAENAAAKADAAARKKREKAALLAAEEAELGPGAKTKTPKLQKGGPKKGRGKKKDDLALLEESLIGAADKTMREKKRKEKLRKEKEERERKKREAAAASAASAEDPLFAATEAMIGEGGGRAANVAAGEGEGSTGIDAAIAAMGVGSGKEDAHPERRMKALHLAFEERMLPVMKEDFPGLKLRQYKDKIFQLWKKSPENPMNMIEASQKK